MPEQPSACVRCGTPYGLTRQPVTVRIGLRHETFDLLFCPSCWRSRTTARHIARIAIVLVLIVVLGSVALAVATGGVAPALVGGLIAALVLLGVLLNLRAAEPRYARTSDGGLSVEIPERGSVRLTPE